jgi:hypothetical protein
MNPYVIVLLLVTLVWGATFPVIKVVTSQLSGIEVSALRFLAAAVILAPSAMQARWNTWRDGAVLGAVALVSYVAQAYGLEFISSNRSAFLTSLNVLMVPLLGIALGARPSLVTLIAACVACGGIALIVVGRRSPSAGRRGDGFIGSCLRHLCHCAVSANPAAQTARTGGDTSHLDGSDWWLVADAGCLAHQPRLDAAQSAEPGHRRRNHLPGNCGDSWHAVFTSPGSKTCSRRKSCIDLCHGARFRGRLRVGLAGRSLVATSCRWRGPGRIGHCYERMETGATPGLTRNPQSVCRKVRKGRNQGCALSASDVKESANNSSAGSPANVPKSFRADSITTGAPQA